MVDLPGMVLEIRMRTVIKCVLDLGKVPVTQLGSNMPGQRKP